MAADTANGAKSMQDAAGLAVTFATTPAEREACYRLRYRVFVEEMGARIPPGHGGLERDRFDAHCHHLMVRERRTGMVIACTRILTDTQARLTGGFYSEQEFDLSMVAGLPGRVMEIGRTCVDRSWRNGGTIAMLWSGLARFMEDNRFGFLIGCASVSMADGGTAARRIVADLGDRHLADEGRRVTPRQSLPTTSPSGGDAPSRLPPLLKAYLRVGAKLGGAPCWDREFGCADLFILLERRDLTGRYLRHFLERRRPAAPMTPDRATA